MRTVNTTYTTKKELEEFIKNNHIEDTDKVLLQIFTGVCDEDFINELVKEIRELLSNIKIIGTTTDGEIRDGNIQNYSTVLSFSIFEKTKIEICAMEYIKSNCETAKNLIDKISNIKEAKVIILFAEGLKINGERFLNKFNRYAPNVIVSGGLSGDNSEFIKGYQFTQDGYNNYSAVCAVLYNPDLIVNTLSNFGWKSIGKEFIVTKSDENRVYSIDNQSPVSLYEKYLGDNIAKQLPSTGIEFPFILKRGSQEVARAVLAKYDDGSLLFSGNINNRDRVSFGYGNVSEILNNVEELHDSIIKNPVESIFIYSCMARRRLLRDNIHEEILPLSTIAPTSGFFTYGEFYYSDKNKNQLLNQTMVILTLSENSSKSLIKDNPKFIKKRDNIITIEALSHLIAQTTNDFRELNNKLEDRVQEELKNNKEKDKILLAQSRLAQMGEMISMIAHQWRQPLTAISSTIININIKIEMEKFDLDNKDDRKLFFEFLKIKHSKISNYVEVLSTTVDDFRTFFKPNKEKKLVTITQPINSALSIIDGSFSSKAINIKLNYQTEDEILLYPNEVMQVILNILNNSKDNFLDRNITDREIIITTKETLTSYIIEIADNGGGIPEDIKENIFDPYFTTKSEKNGTGLGLYMSKTIIEEHNCGALNAYNSVEGVIFKIEFNKSSKGNR